MATVGTGATMAAALTAALTAGKPEPVTIEDVLGSYGNGSTFARELSGLPSTGPLPRKGTPERRRYDTAMRRVQRYRSTGAERRRPSAETLATLRRRALANLARDNLARARARGCDVRLLCSYRVSKNYYTATCPASSGGVSRWEHSRPRLCANDVESLGGRANRGSGRRT